MSLQSGDPAAAGLRTANTWLGAARPTSAQSPYVRLLFTQSSHRRAIAWMPTATQYFGMSQPRRQTLHYPASPATLKLSSSSLRELHLARSSAASTSKAPAASIRPLARALPSSFTDKHTRVTQPHSCRIATPACARIAAATTSTAPAASSRSLPSALADKFMRAQQPCSCTLKPSSNSLRELQIARSSRHPRWI